MATKALTGLKSEWFTPNDQKENDQPTRYKLKPLDGLQFYEVCNNGEFRGDDSFIPNQTGRLLLLRYGMKEWENVLDHKDKPLKFNISRIRLIPTGHLSEIVNRILEISALGAADEKN